MKVLEPPSQIFYQDNKPHYSPFFTNNLALSPPRTCQQLYHNQNKIHNTKQAKATRNHLVAKGSIALEAEYKVKTSKDIRAYLSMIPLKS